MFGFVRAFKPQLRFCEYDTYKAVYCTLCRRQGKLYGPLAKAALSYDVQFLAMLCLALADGFPGYERGRCRANPLKSCLYSLSSADGVFDFPAATAMILTYYKIADNCLDERGPKRLFYRMAKIFFRGKFLKAAERYPRLREICEAYVAEQREAESVGAGLDRAAEPTARALSGIFALCDGEQSNVLSRLGYDLGRWIYLLDAGNDLREDIKRGSFNPLAPRVKGGDLAGTLRGVLEPNLNVCAVKCAETLSELKVKRFRPILENVIMLGLKNSYQNILNKYSAGGNE